MIEIYMKISATVYCIGLIIYIYDCNGIKKKPLKKYAMTNLVASLIWFITVPIAIGLMFKGKPKQREENE